MRVVARLTPSIDADAPHPRVVMAVRAIIVDGRFARRRMAIIHTLEAAGNEAAHNSLRDVVGEGEGQRHWAH